MVARVIKKRSCEQAAAMEGHLDCLRFLFGQSETFAKDGRRMRQDRQQQRVTWTS